MMLRPTVPAEVSDYPQGTTPCVFCPESISDSDFEQGFFERVPDGFAHQACYDRGD